MIVRITNPQRVEICISAGRHTAAQVRTMTGADVVINGGLYDMGTMRPNCHLRVKGVDYASDPYNYIYGYGWPQGSAALKPVESRNKATVDNYICCSWMVTGGKTVKMVYAPATGGRRGNTGLGVMPDGSIVADVHTEESPVTPEELQAEMAALGVRDALRLDGGLSSQLATDKLDLCAPDINGKRRMVHNYICIWGDVEYPEKEENSMKIYLSPSAQPANLYSAGNTNEQVQCNRIAAAAKTALERCGFEVKKAKEGQGYKDNVAESNAWCADIHVPIHTNAGGGHGPVVFVYSRTTARASLAQPVYDALNAVVPTASKSGVQANPGLYEVSKSKAKCVYIECAFHDDPDEARWIIDNAALLGEEIARGLCKGTGVKYVEPKKSTAPVEPERPAAYAAAACGKAVAKGVFKGDGNGKYGWKDSVTRQDLCVVLDRLGLL